MPKAQNASVLKHGFCQRATSRALACLALVALLAFQASMVWHGLEHIAKVSGKANDSIVALNAEQTQPASTACFKCLEDVAHGVGLISEPVQLFASLKFALLEGALPLCHFATPVSLANQRGPPLALS